MKSACLAGLSALAAVGLSLTASAADTRVKCDFSKLERAQKAAQKQGGAALIGPVESAMTPIPLDAVYVIDDAIRRKVMPQELFARRTPNGSVELVARLVNCTDYPLQVQGRATFLDRDQIPTESASAWQTVFLEPRTFGTYREISIGGPEVVNYMIELKGNM